VTVKKSLGYFEGDHLPSAESHARIREEARRAVQRATRQKSPILKVTLPVAFELDLSGDKNPLVTEMTQENLRFIDDDVSQPLSDVDLVAQYERVAYSGPETVTFTCNRYADAYNTLFTIMTHFYERDIEWLMEEVAKPEEYRRDLRQLIAGSPLNYLA
jgi:hypothetical protein